MARGTSLIRAFTLLLIVAAVARAEYYPSRFEDGYSFTAKETTLYSVHDDSSQTVAVIPPGSFIQITGFTEETFFADSCRWGWYEASYRLENTEYTGYVQDRDLAFSHLSLGVDTLFVFSLTRYNTLEKAFEGEIAIIVSGEILLREEYRPSWTAYRRLFDYDVTCTAANSSGLTGVRNLITFYSGINISGVECAEDLIVWTDDNQLIKGPRAFSMFIDEVSRRTTDIILPSTPGGEENRVTLHMISEAYSLEEKSWIPGEEQTTHFLWDGSKFEKE